MPHWTELPGSDQIFTHFDEETGEERTFAASALRRLCEGEQAELAGIQLVWIKPETQFAELCFAKRGLEEHRLLQALTTTRYAPLIFCLLDETHLLVDGTHTYCALVLKGIQEAPAWIIPHCIWKNWLVTGLPETTPERLLATPSWQG